VVRWTPYREFWFSYDSADLQPSESNRFAEIATYMKRNPSLDLAIDGSMDSRGTDPHDLSLRDRRVNAVRDGLVKAGVPTQRIQTGAYGDAELRRDRRVALLIATAK
jgi:outer membrane protein OmpA-like peptidoglycan-associated protein